MHVLIIIGAGASFDCWPQHVAKPVNYDNWRLPLANQLFSPFHHQDVLLDAYNLMGLASPLRSKSVSQGDKFDVETELARINEIANQRSDSNTLQNLFKTRFYLQELIKTLTNKTLEQTHSHTVYVDLLTKLKDWIEELPESRYIDIVVFNYDNLIEKAMNTVYSFDWHLKNENGQLSAYYSGKNLRIYKPHGSINWGREVLKNETFFSYNNAEEAFNEFRQLEMAHGFQYVDPSIFIHSSSKTFIPAIAVPFKEKTNFDECPQEMQVKMLEAINNADRMLTIGWKGADKHFTKLLNSNAKKINEVHIVSPDGNTYLDKVFPVQILKRVKSTFSYFVSETTSLEGILQSFNS